MKKGPKRAKRIAKCCPFLFGDFQFQSPAASGPPLSCFNSRKKGYETKSQYCHNWFKLSHKIDIIIGRFNFFDLSLRYSLKTIGFEGTYHVKIGRI
jgi:hypothetical protein